MAGAIGFTLGKGLKASFFDSKNVRKKMDPKKRRFLSKFGAFVRRTAKSSIKPGGKSGKTSDPGEAPRTQTKKGLRSSIYFYADRRRENVIIGPILIAGRKGGAEALQTLEEGGSTMVEELILKKGKAAGSKFVRESYLRTGRKVRSRIEARPFMLPAFKAEKSTISTIWKKANPKG